MGISCTGPSHSTLGSTSGSAEGLTDSPVPLPDPERCSPTFFSSFSVKTLTLLRADGWVTYILERNWNDATKRPLKRGGKYKKLDDL
jgi:hypothetical protein